MFVWLTVLEKCAKFRDPRLNGSGEILHKAVGCDIFGRFSNFNKSPPEAASDVISGRTLDSVGTDALKVLIILG